MRDLLGQSGLHTERSFQMAMGYYRCIVVNLDLHEKNAVVSTVTIGMVGRCPWSLGVLR